MAMNLLPMLPGLRWDMKAPHCPPPAPKSDCDDDWDGKPRGHRCPPPHHRCHEHCGCGG